MDNFLFHRFTAGIGGYDLFLAACGQMWVGITFFGWVWVGVDGCNLFWWGVIFFFDWVWVGMSECDLFWLGVGGCGWLWPFFGWVQVGVGEFALFIITPHKLFKPFKWLDLYLISYNISTASTLDSSFVLGISSYIAKQTLLKYKLSGSYWSPGFISAIT